MKQKVCLFIVLVLTGVLAACSNSTSPADAKLPTKVLTLVATDIAFDIPVIETKPGQLVRLTLNNDGLLEHDFSIVELPLTGEVTGGDAHGHGHDMSDMEEEPDVHVAAMPGESNTISFTPAKPGKYEFYCTVAGHREAGMYGTLNVIEPSP
jgi:uncharacterized cupredoxin-like copper-binding protein